MLKERILTAVLLAPLAIAGVLWLSTSTLASCVGVIFIVGVVEWASLVGFSEPAERLLLVIAHVLIMGLLWQFRADGTLYVALGVGVAWWLVAPFWLRHFSFAQAPRRRNAWIKATAGMLAIVPAWSALILLHAMPIAGELPDFATHVVVKGAPLREHWWLLFVLGLIWCADVFAYFAGRRFGTVKLAPKISPGKTTAGVYGALIGCAGYAALGGWLLNLRGPALWALVGLALITVVFSIVGDLFESLIKRHSNAKDSGALFPGHGGVFDRLDSIFAALPVFTAGKLLLGI
jgi:phosphatidate cytidylyltransferase